ncbi:MAG: hypothetical protein ING73_00325 [Rhodocyclaceae bacterium]|nr:hypothetical protein [Rhodocyclaceae bacterium]MCA3026751.1 hypothetical protein [Rhodocyclaceae bacterium]MCA3032953.1 hypothetical protein [Rhodocyclaceae bacterium]MCA3037958.1 hypothetical protein [Rhodocyclaceae bacterium]MCA3047415.1 hypothetical protein [Rhodocyclaceae bacterium]
MSVRSTQRGRAAVFGALCMFASGAAFADWACTKKETDATPAQQELFAKAAWAMRTAFLQPPEGWVMRSPDIRTPGSKFCVDFKNNPVSFGASTLYIIKPTADALRQYRRAQAAQRAEIDALKVLPPDVQSKVDALDEQAKALRTEGRAAERAKNRELAKAKYDEVQNLSRQAYTIRNDYAIKMAPQERAIYKKYEPDMELNRDLTISVSLEANAAPAVSDTLAERVVFGNATAKTNQLTDKLVRISASFERNPKFSAEQYDKVKSLIDRNKLQAMIAGNIPSVEESKAAFALQNEAINVATNKALELEQKVEYDVRREEEAAQIAKRQATETGKVGMPSAPGVARPDAAAPAAVAVSKPAVPPASPSTAPPAANPADTVKDAKEAVNKLRGLFGK